jgi:hypothetical protein
MSTLIELAWLPADFHEQALVAAAGSGHDRTGYEDRVHALDALLDGVLARSLELGIYENDPVGEAFVRSHDEPGRDWNMAEWVQRRALRRSNGV